MIKISDLRYIYSSAFFLVFSGLLCRRVVPDCYLRLVLLQIVVGN
jgi:hypothetical protein